jgi:hypothetical protein
LGVVALDRAAYDSISDLHAMLLSLQMLSGQTPPDLLDQSSKQNEQILLGLADDLKLVASRMAATNLECIQRHPCAEQMSAEMKFVLFPSPVRQRDWLQVEVFKTVQAAQLGHLRVKAATAQIAIALFDVANTDDLEARHAFVASNATDLFDLLGLGFLHLH